MIPPDDHIDRLWWWRGGFGRQTSQGCGTVTERTDEVRGAMREARRGVEIRPAETVEEARRDIEAYVIHPSFYEGEAHELAAECLSDQHGIEAHEHTALWLRYTLAAREMGFGGSVPVATCRK